MREWLSLCSYLITLRFHPIPAYVVEIVDSLVFYLGLPSGGRAYVLIDASGFKIAGDRKWKSKVYGPSYHRKRVKAHIVDDSTTNEIIDLIVTDLTQTNVTVGQELLKRLPGNVRRLLASSAFDFCLQAYEQGVKALNPPPSNARTKEGVQLEDRNGALRTIKGIGGGKGAPKGDHGRRLDLRDHAGRGPGEVG